MKLYIVSSALVLLSLSSAAPFASAELTSRSRRLLGGEASAVTAADDITEDSTQFYGGYTPYWQRENGTPYWQRENGTPWWERDNGRSWSSGWNYDPPVLDAMVSEYDIEAVAYGDYGRDEGEEYGDYENDPGFRHRYQGYGNNKGEDRDRSSYGHNPGYQQYKNIMNHPGFPEEAAKYAAVSDSTPPCDESSGICICWGDCPSFTSSGWAVVDGPSTPNSPCIAAKASDSVVSVSGGGNDLTVTIDGVVYNPHQFGACPGSSISDSNGSSGGMSKGGSYGIVTVAATIGYATLTLFG